MEPEKPRALLSESPSKEELCKFFRNLGSLDPQSEQEPPEEKKVVNKVDMGLFELDELRGGCFVAPSQKFVEKMGSDAAEFSLLFTEWRHYSGNPTQDNGEGAVAKQKLDEMLERAGVGITIDDVDLLTSAIRQTYLFAVENGTIAEVVPQIQAVFVPRVGEERKKREPTASVLELMAIMSGKK